MLVAGILLASLALDVVWLRRFRFGYVTEWDESGYIAIALRNTDALLSGGPAALFPEFERQGSLSPLVPLFTVPFAALGGQEVFPSLLAVLAFFSGLVLAVYGVARRLLDPAWAALAALCVAAAPAVVDYSRLYHFAVPAAAFLTAAVWALLRSDRLERRGWVIAAGVLAGLMTLTRTMTISYLPGLGAAALLQLAVVPQARGRRATNLGLGALAAAAVAATWYARNFREVGRYLVSTGYGERSQAYGEGRSVLSWEYWSKELRLVLDQTYVPLAAAVALCVLAALLQWLHARSRREPLGAPVRDWAASDAAVLIVVVLEGYLALVSSRNEGTAFALPWLPALIVLAVAAAARVRVRAARLGLAALLAAVCLVNLLMKSGWVGPLAEPRTVSLPALGSRPVTDGRGIIQLEVGGAGYDVGSPTEPLPELHRGWLPFTRSFTGRLLEAADRSGQRPFVVFGSDHGLFNNTRVLLADALWFERNVVVGFIGIAPGGDREERYRARLLELGASFLETAEEGPGPVRITRAKVERAARSLGFTRVARFAMPDGRTAWLWRRTSRSAAR